MPRRKPPEPSNHERWLVSYADFITLLFAFFVVMFASSQADKGKAQQMSESVKAALAQGQLSSAVASMLGAAPPAGAKRAAQINGPSAARTALPEKAAPRPMAELLPSMNLLTHDLKSEIESGKIQVSMEARGLTISFKQAAAFPSGTDEITAQAYESIRKVAAVINKIPNPVRLEGHTDSIPIHNPRFRSNWELSAARSIAMMELLSSSYGVERLRLSIGGYAETAPIETNDTEEGRARNRRVDIIVLNATGALGEPDSHLAGPAPKP